MKEIEVKKRYGLLDSIRGLVLLSMTAYHTCWDLIYIFGVKGQWYESDGAYIWQQSICWTFILLSGFCWSMGRRPLKRGLLVFGAGAVISLVTCLLVPEERVIFGILTCIGSCMIFMILFEKALRKIESLCGLLLSLILFVVTRNINIGFLGFERWNLFKLPEFLYQGQIMNFLGFTETTFFSTDYFSFFPWFFLFVAGYFIYRIMKEKFSRAFWEKYMCMEWKVLSFTGRHSLIIYMVHQPVIYVILMMLSAQRLI